MDLKELKSRQRWTLAQKIDHSLGTIEAFVNHMGGVDKVYIAFSGGKDSTILSHLARRLYPDILHSFVNTGNEYPEILQFVARCEKDGINLIRLHPKMTPRQVWEKYGFPLVSKETAENVDAVRKNPNTIKAKKALGMLNPNSRFRLRDKWRYLIDEPYHTSNMCCDKLKKETTHSFEKKSNRSAILGTMASESQLREKSYIRRGGCNVYSGKNPSSLPLSVWLEHDVWDYIEKFGLDIAEIYHKGASRTGCVGCGFGCQFPDDVRFKLLYKLHPKYYDMVMNYTNNGVTYREAVSKLLSVNGLYLPDDPKAPQQLEFDF